MLKLDISLKEIAALYHKLVAVDESDPLVTLVTDTRQLQKGDCFLCLKGERFDGHEFAAQALEQGASFVIYEKERVSSELPGLQVADTNKFLGKLALFWRQKVNPLAFAITGSNGKTSTKEILAALFETLYEGKVVKTSKNLNNQFGVPFTLLELQTDTRVLVIEAGMNQPGEIALLSSYIEPDHCLLVSIAGAHLGNLGSVEAIAREKIDLISSMRKGGKLFLPEKITCKDILLAKAREQGATVVETGSEHFENITYGAEKTQFTYEQKAYELPLPGPHQFENFCLAFSAFAMVAEQQQLHNALADLPAMAFAAGRLRRLETAGGFFIWDDTYNANVASFKAGVSTITAQKADRLLVAMGAMAELGEFTQREHTELVQWFKTQGVEFLVFSSADQSLAQQVEAAWGRQDRLLLLDGSDDSFARAAAKLKQVLKAGDDILIKGSRSAKMERLVELLKD